MCSINTSSNGCSATPGSREPELGCPALVQQGECWPNNEPCGTTESEMMASVENLGVAFSQNAWAAAQQEGCLGCPDRYPKWPAKKTWARIDTPQQFVVGQDPDFAIDETPYLQKYSRPPILTGTKAPGNFIPSWPDSNNIGVVPTQQPLVELNNSTQQILVEKTQPTQPLVEKKQPTQPFVEKTIQTRDVEPGSLKQPGLMKCIGNGCRGIAYDLANWDELPTTGVSDKLKHVFLRDDRETLLIYLLLISLGMALILYYLFGNKDDVYYIA